MADEEFIVKCVCPTEQDENEPCSEIQSAFDVMSDSGFQPKWIEPDDCLKLEQRERNTVYIIDPFQGRAFEHLESIGCRIYGPQCVMSCLHLKLDIPKTKVPIYSLAMKDLVISCTSIDKKTREDIHCKVKWMGGQISKDFTEQVTHLVAGEVGSKKYIVAGGLGKLLMLPEWVNQVWKKCRNRHIHGTDEPFQKWRCPVFKDLVITVSGLNSEQRKQVQSLVTEEGGTYSGEMKVNECTHLILNEPKGQKYEFARKWKIRIVTLQWLSESVEKGFCQDEALYPVESRSKSHKGSVSTSTPDKDKAGRGQRLSNMGDISVITNFPDMTHLNETTQSNNTTRLSTEDTLLELDLNKTSGDLFLDGCRVYLSGFRGPQLEKLRKIINCGGATRFNQINESVSHVIMGEKIDSDVKTLQQASFRPHVVTMSWLIECLKQSKMVDEKPFYCMQLQPPSPKPEPVKRLNLKNTTLTARTNENDDEDREMAELMSQYQIQDNEHNDEGDETTLAEKSEDQEVTQNPVENAGEGLFSGKKFVCLGFEEDQQAELSTYITDSGGKVVTSTSRQVPDYAIVPIGGYPVTVTVTEVATNAWLQMCMEQEELLPIDSNELFQPVEIVEDTYPLEGCVLSISGFSGTERDCLMHIAEVLGARCQEYFVRRANNKDNKGLEASTHLITKEADGSKYLAAKKWKLPAVSKQWLFACARSGQRVPEEKFLIDRKAEDGDETVPDPAPPPPKKAPPPPIDAPPPCIEAPLPGIEALPPCVDTVKSAAIGAAYSQNEDSDAALMSLVRRLSVDEVMEGQGHKGSSDIKHLSKGGNLESMHVDNAEENDVSMDSDRRILDEHPAMERDVKDTVTKKESSPEVSPGSCSQKENIHNHHTMTTPTVTKLQHSRVKELQQQVGAEKEKTPGPRTPNTLLRLGIDTPGKFLDPDRPYKPSFELDNIMSALESPVVQNIPGQKKGAHRRKSSVPLEEMFEFHIAQAVKTSASSKPEQSGATRNNQLPIQTKSLGPLHGVVIAVSKKLSSHQAEYNNIASALGADYLWTYDNSCTHYIFQRYKRVDLICLHTFGGHHSTHVLSEEAPFFEGRTNDLNKEFRTARDKGKFVICPYWINMCQEQNARVDESLFPHNYNPNLTLSVVSGKSGTPRSTRKNRSIATATPSTMRRKPQLADSLSVKPIGNLFEDVDKQETPFPNPPVGPTHNKEEITSPVEMEEDEGKEMKLPMDNTGGTLEIREAFNKQIENLIATSSMSNVLLSELTSKDRTKKHSRRKSRRLNSSGLFDTSGECSSSESSTKKRPPSRDKEPTVSDVEKKGSVASGRRSSRLSSKNSEHSNPSQPMQSVSVTWDDETGRLEQERMAVQLQRANSPTQCSQPHPQGLEYDENAQFSDIENDEDLEVQINLKQDKNEKSKKSGETAAKQFRTPTPEPPSIGFPIAQPTVKRNEPEPVELIHEEAEREEVEERQSSPPVFIISGMQQHERDDYGALVEELGGRMLEGQHYDTSCTHLVVGNPTRNEKFLACVASGKWVLHKSYFEACRHESRFVEEEVHEWGSDGTRSILSKCSVLTVKLGVAAHRWRIRLHDQIKQNVNCSGAFDGWKVVLCTAKNKEDNFKRLLEAGGAQVVATRPPFSNLKEATHAFLDMDKVKLSQDDLETLLHRRVNCLKPDYIASFLTEDPPPNPEELCPTEIMALKASISVPDHTPRKRKGTTLSDISKRSRKR